MLIRTKLVPLQEFLCKLLSYLYQPRKDTNFVLKAWLSSSTDSFIKLWHLLKTLIRWRIFTFNVCKVSVAILQSGGASVCQSRWEGRILWCFRVLKNVSDASCKVILKSKFLSQHYFHEHQKETLCSFGIQLGHFTSSWSLHKFKQFRGNMNLYILEPNVFCGTLS